jgi:hypothetical protein
MAEKQKAGVPDNVGKKYERRAMDPRVAVFKAHYTNPNSDTFMNVLQSALRAGYAQQYAESLGCKKVKWFEDLMEDATVRRARMLIGAERSLERAVNYDDTNKDYAALRLKAASFVAERVGKDVYSARQELTDKGGRRLFQKETRESSNIPLTSLFKGVKDTSGAS